jgi:hypothetical protein
MRPAGRNEAAGKNPREIHRAAQQRHAPYGELPHAYHMGAVYRGAVRDA